MKQVIPRIFIAIGDQKLKQSVRTILARGGYSVVGDASNGATALREMRGLHLDLAIIDIDLPGMPGFELAQITVEDGLAPVLLIMSGWYRSYVEKARKLGIALVLKPLNENNLLPAVESAISSYQNVIRLRNEVTKLKENLATRKAVEKAKGILMETLGLTEAEAFRRIQRQSMDKSKSMRAIAEAIILSHELSK